MSPRDVVVVGASAGGVRVLCALVAALPPDLPAAVVVVHVPATGSQVLTDLASGPVVALRAAGPARASHRPAVDALLLSAAAALGPRVVAVVLSGDGEDGSSGVAAVLAAGGAGVVQEPDDALHPSVPRAALAAVGAARPAVVLAAAGGLGAAVTAAVLGPTRAPWARAS